jgi:hypothetical protein
VILTEFVKLDGKVMERPNQEYEKIKDSMLKIKKVSDIFKLHVDSRIYYTFTIYLKYHINIIKQLYNKNVVTNITLLLA